MIPPFRYITRDHGVALRDCVEMRHNCGGRSPTAQKAAAEKSFAAGRTVSCAVLTLPTTMLPGGHYR